MVKGRNEPVAIARVAHVIAQVKGISVEEVCEASVLHKSPRPSLHLLTLSSSAWNNSIKMFGLGL